MAKHKPAPDKSLVASVRCEHCARVVLKASADTWRELAYAMQTLLLATHATRPHTEHRLTFKIEGEALSEEGEPLTEQPYRIECLDKTCKREKVSAGTAPIELMGALALAHHTSHEGHAIKLTWGSRTWTSPSKTG